MRSHPAIQPEHDLEFLIHPHGHQGTHNVNQGNSASNSEIPSFSRTQNYNVTCSQHIPVGRLSGCFPPEQVSKTKRPRKLTIANRKVRSRRSKLLQALAAYGMRGVRPRCIA